MDEATSKPFFERTFGHFARVLIDMEITNDLRHKVLVERKGYVFFVELEYENLPDFCSYCTCAGHYFGNCKRKPQKNAPVNEKENVPKKKRLQKPRKEFVQIKDNKKDKGPKGVEAVNLNDERKENTHEMVNEAIQMSENQDMNVLQNRAEASGTKKTLSEGCYGEPCIGKNSRLKHFY